MYINLILSKRKWKGKKNLSVWEKSYLQVYLPLQMIRRQNLAIKMGKKWGCQCTKKDVAHFYWWKRQFYRYISILNISIKASALVEKKEGQVAIVWRRGKRRWLKKERKKKKSNLRDYLQNFQRM